ncbi:MAG: DEAD/DEAH box helicase [Gammaproteobacteria bacterium]|nr:DEAD/DEAH box helicase [Gammaproteobacteria bacterium]
MPMHPIHRRYYAEDLVRLRRAGERRRHIASQRRGRVDPNPHQIDAVMFALQRIPQGGCILADEVGLGKTIEAGLVIAQVMAESATRILIVVPRPLLGQWQDELSLLFGIEAVEAAEPDADLAADGVFLVGREYAGGKAGHGRLREAPPFDLCLIDEAHEVFAGIHRRFDRDGQYREDSPYARTAHRVREIIGAAPVLLLSATPIQNSLSELWGLVQYVDPSGTLLGDKPVFEKVFCADEGRGVAVEQADELKRRLGTVVQRTLRRQAQEFMEQPFVSRHARLFEYSMSAAERALYDDVTTYLLSPRLHAFSGKARQLLLLGFHRRMASSTAALAASLERVAERLRAMLRGDPADVATAFSEDLEDEAEEEQEADAREPKATELPIEASPHQQGMEDELALVESFVERARSLPHDSKAASLVKAVRMVLDRPADRRKMVVFTESLTTQDYLQGLLVRQTELRDEDITLFRGVNDSPRAQAALRVWRENRQSDVRLSPSAAMRLALVDEFRQRSTVMICSEAGAKGLNLQFCDTVVNYDLPWNPQRIEQRIGRCHRYRQKRDVTVINFLAADNEAQRLTFDILASKLDLFGDVLDMSDVVLQTPRSSASEELASALGPDFEGELRRIWDRARSVEEVEEELRRLSETMEERRQELQRIRSRTAGLIESGLDGSVHDVFRDIQDELPEALATFDAELERVLTAYLDAAGLAWRVDERGNRRLHIGASRRLPGRFAEGASVALGGSSANGEETLHLAHDLIKAAVAEARQAGSGAFRVRFALGTDAPAPLRNRRGQRGRLALTKVAHLGFEREERLCVTAVFEDSEVLKPAEAALELVRQPCTDAPPFDPPLAVSADELDEVVGEEMFLDQSEAAEADQKGFEDAMEQLDQYLADRTLVLRRTLELQRKRLTSAERARDSAIGADNRGRASERVVAAERELARIERAIEALATRDDPAYARAKERAHSRRYALPTVERLLTAEFEIA